MRTRSLAPLGLALAGALAAAALAAQATGPAPTYSAYLPQLATFQDADPDLVALAEAARGLLYPSETDAPLEAFVAPPELAQAPEGICVALANGQPVRAMDAAAFLAAPARQAPWMEPEQLASAARFAALRAAFLARLADPVACRVGGVRAEVYLLGVSSRGALVGLRTVVVQT